MDRGLRASQGNVYTACQPYAADVTSVTVELPHAEPIDDVAITD